MRPYEKQLLEKRLKDFMEEVIPYDLFPYLPCLIQQDKEEIEATQRQRGPIKATMVLVDRLKRRDKGFQDFVLALRQCGGEHTALVLDPFYTVKDGSTNDEAADTDGSGLGFKKIGTAIDVKISGNLLPAGSEEQTESCCKLERYLADRFKDQKSEQSRKMRKELQKHLPKGAVFVNTAEGSIITTIRLASEEAAKELREMYNEGKIQSMLQNVLVENSLEEGQKVPERPLELKISLGEDKFNMIQRKLAEIESEQESESLLTLANDHLENEDIDDDGCEIKIDIPPVFLGSKANSLGGCELVLREYQKELAEPAIQGKNTIICAPTNSGKTYVAIEIAKRHLDSFSSGADQSAAMRPVKEPRVVFIVSTVNLVLQQKERFEAFLGHKYSVGEISGANSTEIPLKYLLHSHDVVVMTAQILVNALKSVNREERVGLKDISLLLFDECHHAHKEHPYNSIMEKYLALKAQAGHQHNLPQIIGLTASLGTGKAKCVKKAEEHIILVSANLDAEAISTVQKYQDELAMYANVPSRKTHFVPRNDQHPFDKIVSKAMDQIEARIKRMIGPSYKVGPSNKADQQYRQWIEKLYKDSVADGHRFLVTYTEQLREYHVALTLNMNTRMKNARKYLQKYFDSLDREKFTDIDKWLEKLFKKAMEALDKYIQQHGEPDNPLLMKLKELLLQNYEDTETQSSEDQSNQMEGAGDNESGDEVKGSGDKTGNELHQEKNRREEDSLKDWKTDTSRESPESNGGPKNGSTDAYGKGEFQASEINEEDGKEGEKLNNEEDARNLLESHVKDGTAEGTKNLPLEAAPPNDDSSDSHLVERDEVCNGDTNQSVEGTDVMENVADFSEPAAKETDLSEAMGALEDTVAEKKTSGEQNAHCIEWEGPKGILFTRTRESTEALLDWIKDTEELKDVLRPERLVGSGDDNIGMTQNEQERVIKRFQTGEKNLLLATTVAEEGLDISDCNYVIRYDMMGNEISTVQSCGRVRADQGKYSVLVGQTAALKRDHTSRVREMFMTEALANVQDMDPKEFSLMVKDIQRKSSMDRFLKKHISATKKSKHLPNDATFRCRKCKVLACQADDIRRIKGSHHVIFNSDFRDSKVDIRKHPHPKTIDGVEMSKKIFCKKCHEDWGVTALINNMEWMCIKICSFVLEFPNQEFPRRMYKKWKDLPFTIDEASIDELLEYGAEEREDKEFDFELE